MDFPPRWPFDDGDHYFASGCNQAAEIRGFAMSGVHVGVSAARLSAAGEHELTLYAGAPLKVLIDSGAFSEIVFDHGHPLIKRPIGDLAWRRRLALMERLARALGPQLHCVAPDQVGSQRETLARFQRYAAEVRRLRQLGAHIIVPLQAGQMELGRFHAVASRVLAFDDFIPGIPLKKRATSMTALAKFADELLLRGKPTRLHLLGCGPRSARHRQAATIVLTRSPWTQLSSDSVRITAMVGRGDGTRRARPLTAALDALRKDRPNLNAPDRRTKALVRVLGEETRAEIERARMLGWFDAEFEDDHDEHQSALP